jgi:beta-N-acetylhexosaminidase
MATPFRFRTRPLAAVSTLLLLAGCTALGLGNPLDPAAQERWIDRTLARMSLREQAASLVTVQVTAGFRHVDSPERLRTDALVRDLGVGGIAMWGGDPWDQAIIIDELQQLARLPLLVGTDNEWGLAQRVGGSSLFPRAMALGAAGEPELARAAGLITGRETRALGIHMGYAPVADVNNNPDNPIINIRSFGEDPEQVAILAGAWADGAHQAGLLTTAKHFPGHGDVSTDSHVALPVVAASMERLRSVELYPFQELVRSGRIDAVMTAHLWLPAFDPDEVLPATLSANVIGGYLRGELGFDGLVVTDAMRMGGITSGWGGGEAAVRAIEAGVDLLLLPQDAEVTIAALLEAVSTGRLTPERIALSARRLLRAKAGLGLQVRRRVPLSGVEESVGDPAAAALERVIARRAVTVARNTGGLLPLGEGGTSVEPPESPWAELEPPLAAGPFTARSPAATDSLRVLFLGLSSDPGSGTVGSAFFRPLRELYPRAEQFSLYPESDPAEAAAALQALEGADLVVAAVFSRVRDSKGHAAVVTPHARLLRYAAALRIPTAVAAFGPPYFLAQFPEVDAYAAAFDYSEAAQTAAGEVFLGSVGARGRLPVTLPGLYPVGWGLSVGPAADRR